MACDVIKTNTEVQSRWSKCHAITSSPNAWMTRLKTTSLRSAITTRTAMYSASATRDIILFISQGGNLHIGRLSLLACRCLPALYSRTCIPGRCLSKHVLCRRGLSAYLHDYTRQLIARNDCFQRNNNQLPVWYEIHTPHTL